MKKLIFTVSVVFLPVSAQAYFDPGTGSLLIQALIGGLAAITVFWGRVKLFITSLFSSSKPMSDSVDGEEVDGTSRVTSESQD